jgi:peptidoglycan/xylan/chitin deacetylase (PgdA/CDA1 family)
VDPLPFGVVTTRLPTTAKVVALTFDAGANGDGLPSILSTLRSTGVTATFFLTGNFARTYPALAGLIPRAGFRLGNHSVDHPYFTHLSNPQIDAQVLGAARSIQQVTGADPAPLFRFPYGDYDTRALAEVNRLGYVAVGWTVDTLGWEGTSRGVTTNEVVRRVMAALQPGEIVLMHVGSNPTDHSTLDADALPRVIGGVKAAGYSFVTVEGNP